MTDLRSRFRLFALTRRFRTSSGSVPRSTAVATVPSDRMVPEVPISAIEALLDDVAHVTIDLLADELQHLALVAAADRIRRDEALGEADDANLEAARELHLTSGAQRDLHAASTDVDHDGRRRRVHAIDRRQVDQARFFRAGDDAGANAGLLLDGRQERAAVLGLTGCARRGGEDLVDLVRSGDALELRERLQRRDLGGPGQLAAVEPAGAEAHHLLLAVDDLEREVGPDPHDDHMNGVGADVDGSEAHGRAAGSL